jgi:hypothetical protein
MLAIDAVGKGPFKPPFTRWHEPPWHDTSRFIQVANALQPTNLELIHAAVSQNVAVFGELGLVRNFFAHRCEGTATKVRRLARKYSLDPSLHPAELLISRSPGRSQSILKDYIDEMRQVVEMM